MLSCKNSKVIIQTFEGIFLNLENTLGMQELYHTQASCEAREKFLTFFWNFYIIITGKKKKKIFLTTVWGFTWRYHFGVRAVLRLFLSYSTDVYNLLWLLPP